MRVMRGRHGKNFPVSATQLWTSLYKLYKLSSVGAIEFALAAEKLPIPQNHYGLSWSVLIPANLAALAWYQTVKFTSFGSNHFLFLVRFPGLGQPCR